MPLVNFLVDDERGMELLQYLVKRHNAYVAGTEMLNKKVRVSVVMPETKQQQEVKRGRSEEPHV